MGQGLEAEGRPVELCPVADGGEGTLDVLVDALGGEVQVAEVSDPLDRPVKARFGLCPLGRTLVGVVETAAASGLGLVEEGERDPVAASSAGTGELIVAALDAGA